MLYNKQELRPLGHRRTLNCAISGLSVMRVGRSQTPLFLVVIRGLRSLTSQNAENYLIIKNSRLAA